MSFLLSVLGYVLLAASLAGVAFGVFMAISSKANHAGKYFALWWVPGAGAASGVVMRDIVTFTIGFACFCIAGLVFAFEARRVGGVKRPGSKKKRARSRDSERTTAENEKRNYRRRAS